MNADEFKKRTDQALQRPSLAQKCEEVAKIIEESSTKELHGFFPELLCNIFGYDCGRDWGLKASQRSIPFNQLKTFLAPSGPIFTLINKLQVDGYLKYEFFIKCLPLPTQNCLSEGNIPLLYHNKIQLSNVGARTGPPKIVLLNAFEYYMFNFAYYIIYQQNTNKVCQDINWQNESTYVYLSVLEDYLNYFLPTLPQANTNSSPGSCPANTWFGSVNRAPASQTQFSGLIRTPTSGHMPLAMQGHSMYDHSSGDAWRSETFIQILIEFWLNQNTMDSVTRNVLSHGQVYFMPSVDVVRAVRMLIKQVHTFVYSAGIDALNHPTIGPLEELKRNVIPQMLQKKFYCFMRHGFAHWPLDPSFRVIVETWLSFIQPWRYANNPTMTRPEISQVFSPEWSTFIYDNFPFFSVITQEFVLRALKLDLFSSKDVFILLRVAKVLTQEGLMDAIEQGEKLLYESPKNVRGSGSSMTANVGSAIRATYMDLEGHAYNYVLEEKLERLVFNISTALASIRQAGGSKTSQKGDQSSWWKTLFSGEFLDSDYNSNTDADKVITYLEQSYQYLTKIAKVKTDVIDAAEQTVPWATPNTAHEGLGPSMTSSSTISHGSIPECVQTERGLVVTDRGRYQMINGLRRFEIHYTGDPELQPIRSYENPTLVRSLYHFSTYLNSKIGNKLYHMYSTPGLLSNIACKLSPCLQKQSNDPLHNTVPSTPSHNTTIPSTSSSQSPNVPFPRISLRFLASYKTMFYFMLFYILCKLFSLGPLMILALFILVLFFSVLAHVCPVYERTEQVQKKLF